MSLRQQTLTKIAQKWDMATITRWGVFALVVAGALVAPLTIFKAPFHQHILIMVLTYGAMATAWNIIGGLGGQPAFGHTVFYGVGAYITGLLFVNWQITPWIGMIAGGIVAVLVSIVIGLPTFRLRGHYFAIATMGTGQILLQVALSAKTITGGPLGLPIKVLPQGLYVFQFHGTKLPYYYIILGLFGLTFLVQYLVQQSRLGYYLRALKESHEAAQSLGINTTYQKLLALGISAFLTALIGGFTCQYLLFVDPVHVFAMSVSAKIMLCTILGGVGSIYGPILGAVLLLTLSEGTRAWLGGQGRGVDLFIYGSLILAVVVLEPFGIVGIYRKLRSRLVRRSKSETA